MPLQLVQLLRNVALFGISTMGFLVFLGLWIYNDASERTDNPRLWTAVVLLVPSFLGLIVYFLVGRDKERYSSGRFQTAAIVCAICTGLTLVMVVGSAISLATADGEDLASINGTLMSMDSSLNTSWSRSFKVSSDQQSRSVNLSKAELAAFHINSSCSSGKMLLSIKQGQNERTLDISGFYSSAVDLSDFSPGRLTLTLITEQARNGNLLITWR